MRHLKIDLDILIIAMENQFDNYLNLETGGILPYSEDFGTIELIEMFDLPEDINDDDILDKIGDNFLLIDSVPSNIQYQHMLDFTQTLLESKIKELLEIALNGRGTFRRFKDALYQDPVIQAQWFEYKEEQMEILARDWCRENDIHVLN